MEAQDADIRPPRRFRKRRIFGAALLLLLILLAIAWAQRFKLADDLIRSQLRETGVRASYEIDEIGFRTERLKNVVLGDPANPDLTARVVEIEVAIGFGTPTIRAVRAEGVRLRGRLVDGKLSFGELDKFADPASKEPFALPDMIVALKDAILSLATPWGGVGVSLDGKGHARRAFDGRLIVRAPKLASGDCEANGLAFSGALRVRASQPEIEGPLSAVAARCAGQDMSVASATLDGKVRMSDRFDNWVGDMAFAANSAALAGQSLSRPAGKLSFFGDAKRTNFDMALDKAGYRGGALAVGALSGHAKGRISFGDGGVAVSAQGDARFANAAVPPSMLAGLDGLVRGTAATPVGPVVAKLQPALQRALRSFDGIVSYDASFGGAKAGFVQLQGLSLAAKSGAQITQSGPLTFADGRLTSPVSLSLYGGGLPDAKLALRKQGRGYAGSLALAPYAAGQARIAIPDLTFSGDMRSGWRFAGNASLSGPLLGGWLEGLSLPVDGRYTNGAFSMLGGCRQVRFARFQTGSLDLPAQSMQACADGDAILRAAPGGTRFAFTSPTLRGQGSLGGSPLAFAASTVRFDVSEGFTASNVSVDLGRADSLTQFDLAQLGGRFSGGGIAGTLEGGAARIGIVPLLIDAASGNWRWQNSILTLDGNASVSDAEQVDRFKTLAIPSMQIALENSIVSAIGYLAEPQSGIRVADVDIRHELNSATGRALLAVENLTFGDRLQPSDLTALTVGAIANVEGAVSGDGIIEWDGSTVRSRGKFETQNLDFAAAFGPVTGLSTEVNFTDLLGLETAPSQIARIAVVNPGIPAFDGKLDYRLLPDQRVQIEGGRWPFYGGELILEPTIIDFDVEAQRLLTFQLVGLDAEKFLASYELENLRVTGVFDGTLPMVFDQDGGRIVGGTLVSRPGGGEVSYLGQLSYEEMGTFANFAFEALRSIRFAEMQIGVNGNIGGEVVTEVRFRGLQQGSEARRNYITQQLAKLPIQFNVRIEAEFLSLIGSLRALYDADYAAERYGSLIKVEPPVTGEEQP